MNKILKSKSGLLTLELRPDTKSAWLTIKRSNRLIDEQEILDLIEEAGIKTGFDEALEYIQKHSLEKDFDKPFPIAISKYGEDTNAAKLIYNFDSSLDQAQISSFSLEELAKISYAEKGDILAEYTDNIFEREGSIYDIFGELITPMRVDEEAAKARAGNNVRYEAQEYIALCTGYPYLDEAGRISILDSLVINAENYGEGLSIRSPLALEIHGDVRGLNIAVANNLSVKGNIVESTIYSDGNLCVEGSIMDCNKAGIRVLGDLEIKNIYNSKVWVRGNLDFCEIVENSSLAVDGNITGQDEDSTICGGISQAAGNIIIGIAGGDCETEIEIAISPFYRSLLMQMTKEMVRLKEEEDELAIRRLEEQIQRCEGELDSQLNSFLVRDKDDKRRVEVKSQIYPKTIFRVLKHYYHVKTPQKGMTIFEKE